MVEPVVLVVDDEKSLRDFIAKNLEVREYTVLTASDGIEAMRVFNAHEIDLVVLDIMMPRMDGLETTNRIRHSSIVPIIVLTALDTEEEKIRALDLGADDYLTKPFGVGELLARVRAVLRRSSWSSPEIKVGMIKIGDITIDYERHEVTVAGQGIKLTPTEYNLLAYLMENAGSVIHHETLLKQVWGPEYGAETEYLRVYIGHLRHKIELDPADPKYLITERGVGYRFEDTENNGLLN